MTKSSTTINSLDQANYEDNNSVNYSLLATQALAADAKEIASKGKAITLAFATLYLAKQDARLSNLSLANVAYIEAKNDKSEAYKNVYRSVFNVEEVEGEKRKVPVSFSNKLKLAFDALAYVTEAERQSGLTLVKVTGDKSTGVRVRVNGRLLDPTDPTEEDCWYSLDPSAKMRASVSELQRKAFKYLEAIGGEALPRGNGNGAEDNKRKDAKASEGVSAIELMDRLSGMIQSPKARGKLSEEFRESFFTLYTVMTEAKESGFDVDFEAAKPAKKAKAA